MIKKIIMLIVVIALTFSVVACGKTPEENIKVIEHTNPPVTYDIKTYLVDSWREDLENGDREYFVTLLTYSNDIVCNISEDDIKYLSDGEYNNLTTTIENVEIGIVNTEIESGGTCSYVKIKTNNLIDTKKIYVRANGRFIVGGEEKTILSSITPKSLSLEEIIPSHVVKDNGFICIYDGSQGIYHYDLNKSSAYVEENKYIFKLYLEQYRSPDLDVFAEYVVSTDYLSEINDGVVEYVELSDNLAMSSSVDGNYVMIEFTTTDGSSIEDKIVDIPSYLTYEYLNVISFPLKSAQ